jgi:hypothetical protein
MVSVALPLTFTLRLKGWGIEHIVSREWRLKCTCAAGGRRRGTLIATNASGSDTLTKPDYITAIEAKEKVYLPLVLRAAP